MADNNDTGAAQSNNAGGQGVNGQGSGESNDTILTGEGGEKGGQGQQGQGQQGGEGTGEGGVDNSGEGDGDKGGDGSDDKGAPESYEAFTMPEGMDLDQGLIDAVSPIFKELDLSQGKAQKLIDAYNGMIDERGKAQADETKSVIEGWVKEIKDDKEYGGAKFNETVRLANRAVSALDKGDLVGLLKRTGLSNHPELIKAFAEAGKLMSEDGNFNSGAGGGGGEKTLAERIYGQDGQGKG